MVLITPEEAQDYRDRWAVAEAFELDELRRTSMETKLLQLIALMIGIRSSPQVYCWDNLTST
jgi:hypothetical protein